MLNSQHDNLEFTVEWPRETLPFLDVEIQIGENIETWLHKKPTNTDVLLNYDSVAPRAWKTGLIKCLLERAKTVCSSQIRLLQEINNIVDVFRKNGYPTWLINREKEKFLNGSKHEFGNDVTDNKDIKCVMVFPYIGKESIKFAKRIKCIFSRKFVNIDFMIAYRNFKVGSYFGLKERTPDLFSTNLVYQFQCSEDGDVSYIGTTSRHLWKRLQEHFDPKKESAIQAHLSVCNKCCNENNLCNLVTVRKYCFTQREAEIAESMFITNEKPSLNKQMGASEGRSYLLKIYK